MSDKTKQGAETLLSRHDLMTLKPARRYLESCVESLDNPAYKKAAEQVLTLDAFWTCPAARGRHQAYPGGLAIHTAQMLECAIAFVGPLPSMRIDAMIVAAMWHDIGKLEDYVKVEKTDDNPSGYEYTLHSDLIGHLSKSYAAFWHFAYAERLDIAAVDLNFIGHLILAHHGRKEWGSPVEPKCAEAWALHCGDMMSSQFIKDEPQ